MIYVKDKEGKFLADSGETKQFQVKIEKSYQDHNNDY